MNKKKAKADKNKFHKEAEKNAIKSPKKKTSFKEWRKNHRKSLLIAYYSVAALVILICVGIILNSFVTRSEVVESEEPINFETEYIDDENLELGTEEVEQKGINGTKKIYTEEKKRLITGEPVSYNVVDTKTVKEPIKEVIKRGTRKWQYMVCSDGSYRYFTDEQFQDPKIGFTHSSEDYCAKNNQGTMIALVDTPPSANSYTSSGGLSDSYVRTLELIERYNKELGDNSTSNSTYIEPFESSINYDPFADYKAKQEAERQARTAAENTCRYKAERARENARRQLGAMGVGGSELTTVPQSAYESTYSNCMRSYGYQD